MTDLDVAVVGGGISGLAAAHRLQRAGRSVHVFELEDAVGGRMRSRRRDGYVIDEGTETLAVHGYPNTWRLIRELGFDRADVVPVRGTVGVWRDQRAHSHVGHPLGGLRGAGLSLSGRLELSRLAVSLMRSARRYDVEQVEATPIGTTTVSEFTRRHSSELYDYLFQPAVTTAFGWSPDRSCMAPLLATLLATRGLMGLRTYRGGMDTLARRLGAGLQVRAGARVSEVGRGTNGAWLDLAGQGRLTARSVLLAVPAPVAADLYPSMPENERPYVGACTYTRMIRVTCLLDRPLTFARPESEPRGSGIYALLLPEREDGVLAGLTLEHAKAADRSPRGKGLVSLLPAPRTTAELIGRPDAEIAGVLLERAERYLPGVRAACQEFFVRRFPHAVPEARPQALGERGAFMRRNAGSVEYAGDWVYQRPTGEAAVRSGELAATRVLAACDA